MATDGADARSRREALRATALTRKPPLERPLEHAELVSTHKRRADWFLERAAWPAREVSRDVLEKAQVQAAAMAAPAAAARQWSFAGPSNIGGRVTAVLAHNEDSSRILIGAAGGGVWRSGDLGQSWSSVWDDQAASLNIGALAADPCNAETVYCGTGEANNSADSHPGVGLYRSTDFGDAWDLIAPSPASGLPTRIGTIAVDPSDPDHLLVGGISYGAGSDGLWQSRDGGRNWVRIDAISIGRYRCQQAVFGPPGSGLVFATLWLRGARSGLWRSRDGGASWQQLTQGLPPGFLIGRGALAIAPSDPQRIYLQLSTLRSGDVLGLYRSDDAGEHWMNVTGGHFRSERQMNYNNAIAVHPSDPDLVVCGGVDIHRSRDGGASWASVTRWNRERGDPGYAHADQHALVMPTDRPGRILAGNDGGLDISEDAGSRWTNRSDGLAVTMFYDVAVAATNSGFYGGGCQDNGTNITVDGRADDFFEVTGGDGGWIAIDPVDPVRLFTSSQSISIYRHTPGAGWANVSPPDPNRDRIWMAVMVMSPADRDTLFVGSLYLWRTTDGGNHWQRVTPNLDDSPISAIEVAPADPDRIYVGTEKGGVYRSDDGGDSWWGPLQGGVLPDRIVTRLRSHPDEADEVYASIGTLGVSHVYRSRDAGANWTDIDNGALPDVPFNGLALSAADPDLLYACCDIGVFRRDAKGGAWSNVSGNLPSQIFTDIGYHAASNSLMAASYGRSLWTLSLDQA